MWSRDVSLSHPVVADPGTVERCGEGQGVSWAWGNGQDE